MMSEQKPDLKDLLHLDVNNLDQQTFNQPTLYWEWGKKLIIAKQIRDKLKDQVPLLIAKAANDIRNNPQQYGLKDDSKVTEAFINSQIPNHPEVKKNNQELADAQDSVNYFQFAVDAIDRLGARLDTAAKFYAAGYFTRGKVFKNEAVDSAIQDQVEFMNNPINQTPTLRKKKRP